MVSQNFIKEELGTPKEPSTTRKLVDLLFVPSSFLKLAKRKMDEGEVTRRFGQPKPDDFDKMFYYGAPLMWEGARLYGYYKLAEYLFFKS